MSLGDESGRHQLCLFSMKPSMIRGPGVSFAKMAYLLLPHSLEPELVRRKANRASFCLDYTVKCLAFLVTTPMNHFRTLGETMELMGLGREAEL